MGATFGRYESLFRIAAGGMAEVHAARIAGEAGFEKLVAVKRMHPHLTGDPEFVAMFLDEARLAANVVSPHVVQTLDLGRDEDDALYIVMELVVGVSLSAIIRGGIRRDALVPVPIACEILAQAAAGLDDAHRARTPTGVHLGIVHRDVSPQNVLVGDDGRVRLADFGVARALVRHTHTSVGTTKGKLGYYSPEQADARALDHRSDVFSLGIVAWETLAGRRLFGSEGSSQIARIRSMPIPSPDSVRPEVGAEISEVVLRALERDPARRWQSAAELGAALRAAASPPGARALATFLESWAPDELAQLRRDIAMASSGEREPSAPHDAAAMHPESDSLTIPDTGSSSEPADLAADALLVAEQATRLTPARSRRRDALLAVGALVLFVAAVGAAFALGRSDATPELPPRVVAPEVPTATVATTTPLGTTQPTTPTPTTTSADPSSSPPDMQAELTPESEGGAARPATATSPARPGHGRRTPRTSDGNDDDRPGTSGAGGDEPTPARPPRGTVGLARDEDFDRGL